MADTLTLKLDEIPQIGTNVLAKVDNNKLVIVIDLTKETWKKDGGKLDMVATTGGFAKIYSGGECVTVSLNVGFDKR